MTIIDRKAAARQPQQIVRLAPAYSRALSVFLPTAGLVDCATQLPLTIQGSRSFTPVGRLSGLAATNPCYSVTHPTLVVADNRGDFTIAVRARRNYYTVGTGNLCRYGSSFGWVIRWYHWDLSSANLSIDALWAGSGIISINGGDCPWPLYGEVTIVIAVSCSQGTASIYMDGTLRKTASITTIDPTEDTSGYFEWGSDYLQSDNTEVDLIVGALLPGTNYDARALSANIWSLFSMPAPTRIVAWGVTAFTGQTLVPTSDITTGQWLSSTGGSLFGAIDESAVDNADYVYTQAQGAVFEVKLTSGVMPDTGPQTVYYEAFSQYGQPLYVQLIQGTTVIASWTDTPTVGFALYSHVLTSPQMASISDWTDLRLRFTALQ